MEAAICSQYRVVRHSTAYALNAEHLITKVSAVKRITPPVSKKFLGSPPVFLYIQDRYGCGGGERETRARAGVGRDWSALSPHSPPIPPLL